MQRSCVFLYELFLHWPRCINKVESRRHRALYRGAVASSAKMWHNRRIHVAAHDVRPPLYLSLYHARVCCEIMRVVAARDCSKGKNFTFKSNHAIFVFLLSQVETLSCFAKKRTALIRIRRIAPVLGGSSRNNDQAETEVSQRTACALVRGSYFFGSFFFL